MPERDPKLHPALGDVLRKADDVRTVTGVYPVAVGFTGPRRSAVVWLSRWRKWAVAAEVVRIGK